MVLTYQLARVGMFPFRDEGANDVFFLSFRNKLFFFFKDTKDQDPEFLELDAEVSDIWNYSY